MKKIAKRKKNKKAGSTTRNIHKIATVMGIVPLVTMSSFLFHDSYALAGVTPIPTLHNVTLDLSSYYSSRTTISASDLFGVGSGYSLTNSIISLAPTTEFNANFNSVLGSIDLTGYSLGTYTVTVQVSDGTIDPAVSKDFKVVVMDSALTADALDGSHGDLDIDDIVKAVKDHSSVADLNADGVWDRSDLTKLLEYIPAAYANKGPIVKSIPDINVIAGHDIAAINLNSYFADPDSNYIDYRVYQTGDKVAVYVSSGFLKLSNAIIGTTYFTIVADDQHGGTNVLNFSVIGSASGNVNHSPVITAMNDFVVGNNMNFDSNLLFTDADADNLNITMSSGSIIGLVPNSYNQLSLQHMGGPTDRLPLTFTADDKMAVPLQILFMQN